MINIINSAIPIGVWRQLSSIQNNEECEAPHLTYGWDQFHQKISSENLTLDINKNPTWQIKFNNMLKYRDPLMIGKYSVLDGMLSLCRKLKFDNFNANDFSLHKIKNIMIVTDKNYDLRNANLRFTAPKIYRENILLGKQPLRSTAFYRNILNKNQASSDLTEGVSSLSTVSEITKDIRSGYIRNVTITKLPFDSHIFSLHDIHANMMEISKFGGDTYEIIDLPSWISCIVDEVNQYWSQKKGTYVGTFVYFGKMKYSNSKKIETLKSISELKLNTLFRIRILTLPLMG